MSIADGLNKNIAGLMQSASNVMNGIGKLQVADGTLAQVAGLPNRAVTLATEAASSVDANASMSAGDTITVRDANGAIAAGYTYQQGQSARDGVLALNGGNLTAGTALP